MSIGQIFQRDFGFLEKIFCKKTILFISNKVYVDLKKSLGHWQPTLYSVVVTQ